MFADRLFIAERRQQPVPSRTRVGHCFLRCKGLRGDDEQRFVRRQITRCLPEVRAIDIGDIAEGQIALAIMPERFVGHDRPEI